ncbi:flippase [bacterium]|nr:flippase [bacterium]
MIISHLGLDMIAIRDMTNNPDEASKIAGNAIIIKVLLAVLSCIICLSITFAASYMGFFSEGEALPSSIYLASIFLFLSFGSIYNCIFQAKMRLGFPALFSVISRILSLIAIMSLVYFKAKLIYIIMTFFFFGIPNVMMGIPELVLLRGFSTRFIKPSMHFDIALCKRLLKDSIPLALSGFFIVIYTRIDQLMIKFWYSFSDLAMYSVAVRLSDVALIIPHSFMTAVFPFLARFYKESDEIFKETYDQSFRYMVAISIIIASIFTLYPERLLSIFYTDDYSSASTSLVILSWALVFVFAGIVNNRILVSAGLQNYDLLFTGLSALVNIILNFIFIPRYGIEGAALATFFAYGTGPIIGLFLQKTKSFSRGIFVSGLRPIIASLAGIYLVYSHRGNVVTSCLLFLFIFWGLMFLIGGITKNDFFILRKLFKSGDMD